MKSTEKVYNFNFYVLLTVMFTVAFMFFANSVFAQEEIEIISVQSGFDGVHKIGGWVPFTITLKNNGEDFDGELQVMGDNFQNKFKSIYALPVNIPQNSEKQFTLSVPVNRNRPSVDIRVVKNDIVVKEKEVFLKKSLPPNALMIGILTDDMSGLRYLSGVNFGNEHISLQSETIAMSEENFPVDERVLRNFGIIFINNFDTSMLDGTQRQKLVQWTENGGLLILGTGPNYKKVLKSLPEGINDIHVEQEVKLNHLNALETYAEKSGLTNKGDIKAVSFQAPDTIPLLENYIGGKLPLISLKKFGEGTVVYLAFDAGIEPFSSWEGGNLAVWKKVVDSAIGSKMMDEKLIEPKWGYQFYHAMNNALRNIPSVEMPSFVLLTVLMGAFILTVGPVNYLVLKKMDKREWSWITIPVAIFIFSLGIYVIGFGTRFSTGVCSIVSILEFNNASKSVQVTAHTGIFNAKRGTLKVTTSKGVDVDFGSNPYIETVYSPYDVNEEQRIISKYTLGDQPEVEFYDKGLWDFSTFIMRKKVEFPEMGINNIFISNNNIKGSIKNSTGFKIHDAFVVIGNSYAEIGDIEIGDEKQVNQQLKFSSSQNRFQILNDIFGEMNYQPGIQRDDEWRYKQQRRSIFEYYYMTNQRNMNSNSRPVLYGWTDADLQFDVYTNDKPAKKYYQNLIVMPLALEFDQGDNVQLPYGFVNAVIESTEGNARVNPDPYSTTGVHIEGGGKAVFKFAVPQDITVQSFTINWYAPHMYSGPIRIKMMLYNFNESKWDEITSYYTVNDEFVSRYISEENEVKVMFDANESADIGQKAKAYYGMVNAPDIELKGVAR